MKEFLDIFPEELPVLPPKREILFGIELLRGTVLVPIALYRMAPKELKEFKAPLSKFLDRGFIRPSVSPWGALIFFV